ncbi:MAG: alpha/beta hydrolase family protein, partial [bacterium]
MIINPFRSFAFLASLRTSVLLVLLSGSLLACGGSSSNNNDTAGDLNDNRLVDDNTPALTLPTVETLINVPAVADAERGALISVKHLKHNTQAAINTVIAAQPDDLPAISALYDVEAFQLNYLTVDGRGALTEASALITLPQKSPLKRSPLLSFQHGTVFYNAEAPTSIFDETAPEVVTASLGYIVLSADYIGYGASLGKEHPYLLAHPSANAVIDLFSAAKTWLDFHDYPYQPQLFLTGYSEGGYVTMATHKIMQEDQIAPFN